jgi:hypothetical protein
MKTHFLFLFTLVIFTSPAIAEPFSVWIASKGLTGADALPGADPDLDGHVNFLEYCLADLDPTVPDPGNHPSLPQIGWLARRGNDVGNWEWVAQIDRSTGLFGVWHVGMRYKLRPGAQDARILPQLSDRDTLRLWFDGSSAWQVESLPGNTIQAGCLARGNIVSRAFIRLTANEAPGLGDVFESVSEAGFPASALVLQTATAAARVITAGSSTSVVDRDLTLLRESSATAVTDWRWIYSQSATNPESAAVSRYSSNPAVLTPSPSDPTLWTWQSNGSATLTMSTSTSVYSTNATTTTLGGQTVDTVTAIAPTSLRAHLNEQVDSRLANKTPATGLPIYTTQNHTAATYVRNPNCWAATVDLTPISPWNSNGANHKAGILISPRHVLFATHYAVPAGATIRFITADNTVVTRTVSATASLAYTAGLYPDFTVGRLDSDVPTSISFARVLPDNWATYLPTMSVLREVASIGLDQEEKALVSDVGVISPATTPFYTSCETPKSSLRLPFYENKISGDSGNPCCLIIDGKLVVLTVWTGGGGGTGTFVTAFRAAVNGIMTSLGGGYQLTNVDLSGFPSYP